MTASNCPVLMFGLTHIIQLPVVSVAVNRGKVYLDNLKQFACVNREKKWPEARALRYTEVQIQTLG